MLHHVEDFIFFCVDSHRVGHFDRLCLLVIWSIPYNDYLVDSTCLDCSILLALLDNLFLRLLVNVVINGLCVEGQCNAHDRQEDQQFPITAAR